MDLIHQRRVVAACAIHWRPSLKQHPDTLKRIFGLILLYTFLDSIRVD